MTNPWRLTPRQVDVIRALVDTGSNKGAARLLGLSPHTAQNYMETVRKKMGKPKQLLCAIAWDRWERETHGPRTSALAVIKTS